MRSNLPVTQHERTFSARERLISTTDLHGKITYCNDAFVAISGFAREELLGQPHNLVRTRICRALCLRICGTPSSRASPGWGW